MAKLKLQSNASGTGVVTLTAPNTDTDRTITLPDSTGTVLDSTSTLDATKLSGDLPAIDGSSLTNLPAGGKVLQVVYFSTGAEYYITSTTLANMFSTTITPTAAGSSILIFTNIGNCYVDSSNNGDPMQIKLRLGSTDIDTVSRFCNHHEHTTKGYLHTPTYTLGDTLTYRTAGRTTGGGGPSSLQNFGYSGFVIYEIGA